MLAAHSYLISSGKPLSRTDFCENQVKSLINTLIFINIQAFLMNSRSRAVTASTLLVALFMPPTIGSSGQGDRRTVRTTAYTHTESDHVKYGRKNALGTRLQRSSSYTSAAADWSRFPVGTTFRMKGSKTNYIIDDYGSALVGTDTIDIYHTSKSAMNRWGVRHVEIEITKMGDYDRSREILSQRTKYRHCRQMLAAIPDRPEQKRGWFWNRKPKDDAPAPDPAPAPKPQPQRAPEKDTSIMLASAEAKESKKRGWFWNRKSDERQPVPTTAPTPKPQPTPAPAARPEPQRAPVMLASNTTKPAPTPAPPKPAPKPTPKAPAPMPTQLTSATPAPKPVPSPATQTKPTADTKIPAPVLVADNTPAATASLPAAAVPRVRAVKPIAAASLPKQTAPAPSEPIATSRRPGASQVVLASAATEATASPVFRHCSP